MDIVKLDRRDYVCSALCTSVLPCCFVTWSQHPLLTSNISKFADDTKIGRTIRTGEEARALQEDLNKLSAWSEKWQLSFNISKCSELSIGTRNPVHGYSLDSTAIGRTDCERDLGVYVNSDLKLRE